MSENVTIYNKNDVYTKEIQPEIMKINEICVAHNIPFLFTIATANNEKKTTYNYAGNLPGSMEIKLSENRLTKQLAVACGFGVFHPSSHRVLEDEDINIDGPFDFTKDTDEVINEDNITDLNPLIEENIDNNTSISSDVISNKKSNNDFMDVDEILVENKRLYSDSQRNS